MATKNQTTIKVEPGKQEFFITREFEGPRDLVFKLFSDPELIPEWLGCRDQTTRVEKHEGWNGGSYRFIHTDPQGNEYCFHGVFHDITAPERVIRTFEFEGLPESGHVILETVKFEELPGGRTRLTGQSVFQSVADRDGMVGAGMEYGVNDSYGRFDELLERVTQSVK